MGTLVLAAVGLLLAMGYFIGVKQNINLVHSYHHHRVAQQDQPVFCRRVGLGNAILGGAILAVPVLLPALGLMATFCIAGIGAVAGIALVISTIIKYNHGLF